MTPSLILADEFDSNTNQICLHFGSENNFIRDDQSSPLAYSGFKLFPFHIAYKNYNERHITTVNIYWSKFSAKSESNHKAEINCYNFQLSYLQNTNILINDKWKLFAGAVWQNQFNNRYYDFSSNISSAWTFFASSNLSGQLLICDQINKSSSLQIGIGSPLVAYIIRSGYVFPYPDKLVNNNNYDPSVLDGLKSGDFATINRFRCVTINCEYTKMVSEHLMFGLTYNFSYYRDYKHFLFRTASISFGALINYMW